MLDSNNQDIKSSPFGVKFGVIASLSVIIYSLLLNITGLNMNEFLGIVTYLIIGVIMYIASNNYKEANKSFVSFSQSLGLSMIVVTISSVVSSIFSYIYIMFVDGSMIDLVKEQQLEELEKQGMSDAQIEQTMEYAEVFMTPGALSIMALIMMLFFGLIIGLIISAIVKNPRPIFE